jgi:hypothetical protein
LKKRANAFGPLFACGYICWRAFKVSETRLNWLKRAGLAAKACLAHIHKFRKGAGKSLQTLNADFFQAMDML